MAHQETHGFDPEMVHRYFDGELDAAELREAEAVLERSPEARAMLASLDRQSALLRSEAASWERQLSAADSDALFARIEAQIDAARPAEQRPALRSIPGGRPAGRGRIYVGLSVVLAAAAAALLWVKAAPDVGGAGTGDAIASHVRGSEVIAVDFGQNAGTLFNVEGQAGEALAVVWISDQVEQP